MLAPVAVLQLHPFPQHRLSFPHYQVL